ncbi:MAG: response regulator transcription factor [Lentihominibacter sp.]
MKTMIVDDERIMLDSFNRISSGIEDLEIVGSFQNTAEALKFAKANAIELAILDVVMPGMNGIELGRELKKARKDILLVYISAYAQFIKESNWIGADYYIVKPYERETIEMMMEKMRLLKRRQEKDVYIHTFGKFNVMVKGKPIKLNGKAKEILALIVTRRGKELSNEEIYSTIWEDREYSNEKMKVFHNALKRLRLALEAAGLQDLLISTSNGQMVNVSMFDCDYYNWKDGIADEKSTFEGEFMSDYSWGEVILAEILGEQWK